MKVNGKAFKKAREQIRKAHADEPVLRGDAAIGTQEWLAQTATYVTIENGQEKSTHPTVKTIQNLENKGLASLPVILAVSVPLRINGFEFILDYGKDAVTCQASGVVDFRPQQDLLVDPINYHKTSFLVTIDPLLIKFDDGDLYRVTLKEMTLTLQIGDWSLPFRWLYNVSLIPGKPWLGIEGEVEEVELLSPAKYRSSIMFKQDGAAHSTVTWKEFIELIRATEHKQIDIRLHLNFEHFYKEINILISVEEIKGLFLRAKEKYAAHYEKYHLDWPRFLQPNALIFKND